MQNLVTTILILLTAILSPCAAGGVDFNETRAVPVVTAVGALARQGGREEARIQLSAPVAPEVFVLEGDAPRVVCDIRGALLHPDVSRTIQPDGVLIRTVRTWPHEEPEKKVRVVLDLEPGHDYEISQTFYRSMNLFTISVSELSR